MAKPKTKEEIINKLTELGIEFDPKATKDELLALLPLEEEAEADEERQEAPTRQDAIVYDVKGNSARVYSKEVHGHDFRKLAEEFAGKREGWTVR